MKYRGIHYDTGTLTTTGGLTRTDFIRGDVVKEIMIIKNELHCNAIRISGMDLERLETASEIALELGLTVWFSPSLPYDSMGNTFNFLIRAGKIAESLRGKHDNLVFVCGCELTVFTEGFIPGATGAEKFKHLYGPLGMIKNLLRIPRRYNRLLNEFLLYAVSEIKRDFKGRITYASGTWEKINWSMFDLISVDYYRSVYNKSTFLQTLLKYKSPGKPLCIAEFGCCAYVGAEDKGAMGWAIVDWKSNPPKLKGNFVRDEKTQADYLIELLEIFDRENIYAAFAFTFISGNYVHHPDPAYDLDMAAYGIVKVMPDQKNNHYAGLPWQPKLAFYRLAEFYGSLQPEK